MLNIVFSIPIHQKLEVVLDQICNLQHFNPNCGIVFHMSKGFDYKTSLISKEYFLQKVKQLGNVFINPESVRTGFADIIQAHISNFEYISKTCSFEYFAICASNESFVRSGLYKYIKDYDCGYEQRYIERKNNWVNTKDVFNDEDLMNFLKSNRFDKVDITHPEGVYFKKDMMSQIVEAIKGFYDYRAMKVAYPREEIYFSTVACNKFPAAKVGKVFTYSAYHYGRLWDASRLEIAHIIKSCKGLYTIKRVNRNVNDNVRVYLRAKFGYTKILRNVLPSNIKVISTSSSLRVDVLSFLKLVNVIINKLKKVYRAHVKNNRRP